MLIAGRDGIQKSNELEEELLLGLEHHKFDSFTLLRCPRLEILSELLDGLDARLRELAVMGGHQLCIALELKHIALVLTDIRMAQGDQEAESIAQGPEGRGNRVLAGITEHKSATEALLAGGHGTIFERLTMEGHLHIRGELSREIDVVFISNNFLHFFGVLLLAGRHF